jgi:hypothetical protein
LSLRSLIAATVPLERELKIMKLASRLALPRLQFLHPLLHSVRSLLISYRVTPKMNRASFNDPEAILPSNPRYNDRMTHPDLAQTDRIRIVLAKAIQRLNIGEG